MGVTPQTPAPQQQRSGNLVAILVVIFGLLMVLGVMGVWLGIQVISRGVHLQVKDQGNGNKLVTITTPVGSMNVSKQSRPQFIGLPVYPGASPVKDQGSATVDINLPDSHDVQVAAQKYLTADSIQKVRDYYKQQLGSLVTHYKDRNAHGESVFEIKTKDEDKIVALKTERDGKTRIALVRVLHGTSAIN